LVRDLSQMKGQSFAIAIVIAAGVATFVNSRTILYSLELTRSTFYERYRFADVFARVKRAPDVAADGLAEIPGVAQVETRIVDPDRPRLPVRLPMRFFRDLCRRVPSFAHLRRGSLV
jgi:putative ABC transport system permease protein